MLQNIRNNSQGLVAKFIIGLIIIPFALFGIDSLVGGGGPANVATVNGEDITLMELDQAMNLERRRLLNRMGENADPSLLTDELLRGPVLERLIQQHLLMQAASDESVVVSATRHFIRHHLLKITGGITIATQDVLIQLGRKLTIFLKLAHINYGLINGGCRYHYRLVTSRLH